jgi:hypothetical protein
MQKKADQPISWQRLTDVANNTHTNEMKVAVIMPIVQKARKPEIFFKSKCIQSINPAIAQIDSIVKEKTPAAMRYVCMKLSLENLPLNEKRDFL